MGEKYAGIAAGKSIRASDMEAALDTKENNSNKVTILTSSSTDAQYPSAKAVYDKLNALDFFPKGTILMYDGTSWTDNVTLKGWYQCSLNSNGTAKVVNGLTIPDLRDKFIMGYSSGSRTGGVNAQTLLDTNLPAHSHTLKNEDISITGGSHSHSFKNENITSGGGAHSHGVTTSTTSKTLTGHFASTENETQYIVHDGIISMTNETTKGGTNGWDYSNARYYIDATHSHTGTASNESPAHTHTVNLSGKSTADNTSHTHTLNLNGKSTNTAGSSAAFDNRPSYYALIYIIKVTNPG